MSRWLAVSAVLLVAVMPARAGEMKMILREQINVEWRNELVSYPLSAKQGECVPGSVRLVGPGGPQAVQLRSVEYWPDGKSVKSARVAFVTDLAPLETRSFTVQYGSAAAAGESPGADLKMTPGEGQVELATSRFGVRLLLGEKTYDPPVATGEAPGPLAGLRAPEGTWYAGSRMYGPGKVSGYSAKLVEAGPVVGRVVIRYSFEGGRTLELSVQVAASGGQARWDMNVEPYDRKLAAQLTAGVGWAEAEKLAADTAAKDGFELLLSKGLTDLQLKLRPFWPDGTAGTPARWGGMQRDRYGNGLPIPIKVEVAKEPPGELVRLRPWSGWFNQMDMASFVFGTVGQEDLLHVAVREGGEWVEPAALGTWASYSNVSQRHKLMPLLRGEDGSVTLQVSAAPGVRKWQMGVVETVPQLDPYAYDLSNYAIPTGMWPLDQVKDLVLDWPEDVGSHPRVFFTAADLQKRWQTPTDPQVIQDLRDYIKVYQYANFPSYRDPKALTLWLYTGNQEYAEEAKLVERLRIYLGNLGRADLMRQASQLACMYDGLADSGLLTAEQRKLFQAQMAFLAYVNADPGNWSLERGYCSGNQNMSVAHILNQGMLAATLPEHPLAKEWSKAALFMMDKWLADSVGPQGEWPESLANYVEVSASMICVYAVAAKNAGIHDFTADPRFQRLMLYIGKHYTPPDPRPFTGRKQAVKGSPPSGRGPAYHPVSGLFGLVAQATAKSNPAFSSALQWLWLNGGKSTGYLSDRMGGLENVAMERPLPAAVPAWGSEQFPLMDVLLRHGIGSTREYYANLVMDPKGYTAYYSENGGFAAIWCKGVPTTVRFAGHGYGEREEIFTSRVLLARTPGDVAERTAHFMYTGPMAISAFATLPRQDYVVADVRHERAKALWHSPDAQDYLINLPKWPSVPKAGAPPVDWKRQVLFVKGADASLPTYFLLRDSVKGNQPTMWEFWTLSEKIGTPEDAANREAFLADKPGDKPVDARELRGDRFTALGQLGVDVEYYLAAPTDTPRHTLRYGHKYYGEYTEYQDCLHLQLPGDGAYYVVYYPRRQEEAMPVFTTLGEGKIIKMAVAGMKDYAFLSETEATAAAEGVSFRGTAGSVQDRVGGLVLSLGAPGRVSSGQWSLESAGACGLQVLQGQVVVQAPPEHAALQVTVGGPGKLKLSSPPAGVKLKGGNGLWTVTVPAGVTKVTLAR